MDTNEFDVVAREATALPVQKALRSWQGEHIATDMSVEWRYRNRAGLCDLSVAVTDSQSRLTEAQLDAVAGVLGRYAYLRSVGFSNSLDTVRFAVCTGDFSDLMWLVLTAHFALSPELRAAQEARIANFHFAITRRGTLLFDKSVDSLLRSGGPTPVAAPKSVGIQLQSVGDETIDSQRSAERWDRRPVQGSDIALGRPSTNAMAPTADVDSEMPTQAHGPCRHPVSR